MKLAALILAAACSSACAETTVGLHLVSHHASSDPMQNNVNPGAYLIRDGWTVGAYRNTLKRDSVYAGHTWDRGPFSITAGFVSGYEKREYHGECAPGVWSKKGTICERGVSNAKLLPMLAPSVRVGPTRLWYLPGLGHTSSVIHLSVETQL